MQQGEKRILLAAALGWLVPAVILMASPWDKKEEPPIPTEAPLQTVTAEYTVHLEGDEVPLETYLIGVLAAEMPASFELEALKAQAVVARTYALKRCEESPKHGKNGVCTDPACCQGYVSGDGIQSENWEKLRQAVKETRGMVLTYEGQLAEATYFSSSGGTTEAAYMVWGGDVPYLQSVESPDERNLFEQTVFFSREELENALGIDLSEDPEDWIGGITYTESGSIDTWEIEGETYRGTEIRRLLGLKSTCIHAEPMGDGISVSTVGFGHRVGMSQYGADAMAVKGRSFREILSHYYPGTEVTDMEKLSIFS